MNGNIITTYGVNKILLPLELIWEPKEDITAFELALCLPYFYRGGIMPYEINQNDVHMRHFKIIDHNK